MLLSWITEPVLWIADPISNTSMGSLSPVAPVRGSTCVLFSHVCNGFFIRHLFVSIGNHAWSFCYLIILLLYWNNLNEPGAALHSSTELPGAGRCWTWSEPYHSSYLAWLATTGHELKSEHHQRVKCWKNKLHICLICLFDHLNVVSMVHSGTQNKHSYISGVV